MLKYRYISIIFICIIVLLALTDLFLHISLFFYGGTILVYIALLAWGSANIRSGFYINTLCQGKMESRSIALTFDDGPDIRVTPLLLDLLERENIRAAFFVTGNKAENQHDLIRRIDSEGHILGAHSYSHSFFFDLFSRSSMVTEIEKTEEIIGSLINKKVKMFRPPYGVTNPALADVLRHMEYHVIGWSLRSGDTVIEDEEKLLKKITGKVKAGDVVLFHDTKIRTLNVMDNFIKFAKENGLSFERLDKHLGIKSYE